MGGCPSASGHCEHEPVLRKKPAGQRQSCTDSMSSGIVTRAGAGVPSRGVAEGHTLHLASWR